MLDRNGLVRWAYSRTLLPISQLVGVEVAQFSRFRTGGVFDNMGADVSHG